MEVEIAVISDGATLEGENKKPKEHTTVIDLASPPAKKVMKQARLPFKVLAPKSATSPGQSTNQKKRKLSDPHSGAQKLAKTPKKDENSPKCIQKNNSKIVTNAENEVSSSSEADQAQKVKSPILSKKPKTVGLLDHFVHTTQQLEVSTSTNTSADGEAMVVIDSDNEAEGKEICVVKSANKEAGPPDDKSTKADSVDTTDVKESGESSNLNSSLDDTGMEEHVDSGTKSNGEESSGENTENPSKTDETQDKVVSTVSSQDNTPSKPAKDSNENATEITPKSKPSEGKRKKSPPSSVMKDRERLRLEKLKQKEDAKAEKEKKRNEEKERKEQERLEAKKKKDEEKQQILEQKQQERDEKLKQKEEERKKKQSEKDEEKRKKQEIVDAKNEERKKKEEEKQKAEDEVRMKKEKAQAMFNKFFTKSEKQAEAVKAVEEQKGPFIEFQVKDNMRLAPMVRVDEGTRQNKITDLDSALGDKEKPVLYLDQIKEKTYKRGTATKTYPLVHDVEVMSEASTIHLRAKLFQFRENYRPAYYGTWRKKSKTISPRNPLKKDEVLCDYDVDSDEEWEEEEPGESLSDSEGEGSDDDNDKGETVGDDDGEGDGDGDGDGFFVPHGYLSEGEGCEDDDDDITPERLKARQLAKAKAWDADMKKKNLELLRPVCIGCLWSDLGAALQRNANWEMLQQYAAVPLVPTPIPIETSTASQTNSPSAQKNDKKKMEKGFKFLPVPDEAMPDLIRLVHGNMYSIQKLVKEFREYWRRKSLGLELVNTEDLKAAESGQTDADSANQSEAMDTSQDDGNEQSVVDEGKSSQDDEKCDKSLLENDKCDTGKDFVMSKRQLGVRIREVALYEKRSMYNKKCWYVNQGVLEKHGLTDVPVPTNWHWLTRSNIPKVPKRQAREVATPVGGESATSAVKRTPQAASTPNIKQFAVAGYTPPVPSPSSNVANKSVLPAVSTPNIKQFAVAGYTPPIPSPSTKPSAKLDPKNLMQTPKMEGKQTGGSDTPKRSSEQKGITPSALFSNSPGQVNHVAKLPDTPTHDGSQDSKLKDKNQRTLMSMFSPQTKNTSAKKLPQGGACTKNKSEVILIDDEPLAKKPLLAETAAMNDAAANQQAGSVTKVTGRAENVVQNGKKPGDSADLPMEID